MNEEILDRFVKQMYGNGKRGKEEDRIKGKRGKEEDRIKGKRGKRRIE